MSEIKITGDEIMSLLVMKPSRFIKNVYKDLEKNIILGKLENSNEQIKDYLLNKYGTIL